MNPTQVPESVVHFISEYISSVEELKVLLLLFQNPGRSWTVREITNELRSSEGSIEKRLRSLYQRKVLKQEINAGETHRFLPYSKELHLKIQMLSDFERLHPYSVLDLIYSQGAASLRDFADAFKIKKGDQ